MEGEGNGWQARGSFCIPALLFLNMRGGSDKLFGLGQVT